MHLEKFRASGTSFFSSISIIYNYLLIFYDILVFTIYKTRTIVFIVIIKLAIRKKTDGTLTYDSGEEDNWRN